jgi:outer membrane receptor for ferric coprogen and ferric-rhodotorulic acid
VLPPIEGQNLEAGIKGAWFDNKLSASLAIFQVRQNNTAEAAGFDTATGQTYYATIDAKSEGIEFDLAGQIVPGLQASAGYTVLRIRDPQGQAVRTYVPRNTARASLTWTPDMLPALKLGSAIKYQSNIRRVADATTASGEAILIRQPGYALVDLMARYDITPHWSLSANLNNLTNRKYLTSLYWDQAYYGAPRTASVTIGWKF